MKAFGKRVFVLLLAAVLLLSLGPVSFAEEPESAGPAPLPGEEAALPQDEPSEDPQVYTVVFLPGEGEGEPVSFSSDQGEIAPSYSDSVDWQFFYDWEGKPAFRMDPFSCMEGFEAPEGKIFDYWDPYGPYLELTGPVTQVVALWKDEPVLPCIVVPAGRVETYASFRNLTEYGFYCYPIYGEYPDDPTGFTLTGPDGVELFAHAILQEEAVEAGASFRIGVRIEPEDWSMPPDPGEYRGTFMVKQNAVNQEYEVVTEIPEWPEDGYYLIGPDWNIFSIDTAQVFEEIDGDVEEYRLVTELRKGTELQVVLVEEGILTWYPEENAAWTVDAAHAGAEVEILFRPEPDPEWDILEGHLLITVLEPFPEITLTLEPNGGQVEPGSVTVTAGEPVGELPVPVRENYTFDGWFTEDGEKIEEDAVLEEDLTLVAHWHLPGDVNGDGRVSTKDFVTLMKYLAGEEIPVVEGALDVNGDEKVSTKDFVTLMKYLAGEEIPIY